MKLELYYMDESPPCRAVMMLIRQLDLPVDMKYVNLATGEHTRNQDLVKLNPLKLVPTINDNGLALWESRAIMRYLVDKYSPDSPLYPKSLEKRAKIDLLLDFDLGTLYPRQSRYLEPLLAGIPDLDSTLGDKFKEALSIVERHFLLENDFLTGPIVTIADISLIAGLSYAQAASFDFSPFPKLSRYLERLRVQLPHYGDVNGLPVQRFAQYLKDVQLKRQANHT